MKQEEKQKHHNVGNSHAKKEVVNDTYIHIRCLTKDKSSWVKAAQPDKLSKWVIKTLNEAIEKESKKSNDLVDKT